MDPFAVIPKDVIYAHILPELDRDDYRRVGQVCKSWVQVLERSPLSKLSASLASSLPSRSPGLAEWKFVGTRTKVLEAELAARVDELVLQLQWYAGLYNRLFPELDCRVQLTEANQNLKNILTTPALSPAMLQERIGTLNGWKQDGQKERRVVTWRINTVREIAESFDKTRALLQKLVP